MHAEVSAPAQPPSLLIVDDEPDIVDIGRICFETKGWDVLQASSIVDAMEVMRRQRVDAVLSDLMMRGGSGLDLLAWVRRERGDAFAFYLLTACMDERVIDARGAGVSGIFSKPCEWAEVIATLSRAVRQPPSGTPRSRR